MAASQANLSLDDILKISRQKKENEKFAQKVFGRDRRSSAPVSLGGRAARGRDSPSPSLASRVGIMKPAQRAKSSRDLKAQARANTVRPSPLKQELGGSFTNGPPTQPRAQNISIRGLAGPAIVMGSNFAPGTTAADIQSAMEPVGGQIQSCRVVTARPTVIAEIVFNDRAGAEAVIETFNNQKADGRLLHIYLKTGPGGQNPAPAARDWIETPVPRTQPAPSQRDVFDGYDQDDGRMREGSRSEAGYQDGRYGFEAAKQDVDGDMDMDEQPAERVNDRPNDRQRDEPRFGGSGERRGDRNYRQPDSSGWDRRYGTGSRENRVYNNNSGNWRGRGFR